jgi:hypothetical protein
MKHGKVRQTDGHSPRFTQQVRDNIAICDMKLEEFVQGNCMLSGGSNLLVPEGVTADRMRARYVVRVYQADIVTSTINKAKTLDRIDSFVRISFAGLKVRACIL